MILLKIYFFNLKKWKMKDSYLIYNKVILIVLWTLLFTGCNSFNKHQAKSILSNENIDSVIVDEKENKMTVKKTDTNNLKIQKPQDSRLATTELATKLKPYIEKKIQTTFNKNFVADKFTIVPSEGNNYEGLMEGKINEHETTYKVKITYDGENAYYEVRPINN